MISIPIENLDNGLIQFSDNCLQAFGLQNIRQLKVLKTEKGLFLQPKNEVETTTELKLPFEPLKSKGVVVTNQLVNELREIEGI